MLLHAASARESLKGRARQSRNRPRTSFIPTGDRNNDATCVSPPTSSNRNYDSRLLLSSQVELHARATVACHGVSAVVACHDVSVVVACHDVSAVHRAVTD